MFSVHNEFYFIFYFLLWFHDTHTHTHTHIYIYIILIFSSLVLKFFKNYDKCLFIQTLQFYKCL